MAEFDYIEILYVIGSSATQAPTTKHLRCLRERAKVGVYFFEERAVFLKLFEKGKFCFCFMR